MLVVVELPELVAFPVEVLFVPPLLLLEPDELFEEDVDEPVALPADSIIVVM